MKTLSRFLVALVAVLLVGAPPLAAAYSTALNAVTTGTASAIIPSGGAANIEVYLKSASTSTSTVTIELCAQNAAATCYVVATISNVAAAGAWYAGPAGPYFRVNASAVSAGAVTALYGMDNNGARLPTWRDVKVPAASGAGTLAITDVNATGTVTAATLASTGGVTAATTVAATGGVSGTTGTFSAGVSGTTGTFSGAVSGTTGTFSGAVAGTTGTFSGAVAGTTGTFTGAVAGSTTGSFVTSLTSPLLIGASKSTIAAKSGDGAIASAPGVIVITKGSALGSSTLATPTTTTHDGYILTIVSSTAFAHVVSVASGKVNGGTNTTITFTSAAIGDSVTLVAYQGVWYTVGAHGTITLT
jgi:hypothetical protein